jgi:hypothetical protein
MRSPTAENNGPLFWLRLYFHFKLSHKKAGYIVTGFLVFITLFVVAYTSLLAERPNMSETINNTMKMKNKILAMEAAPAATPPNPKIAAIIATIRNITDQRSIKNNFRVKK